MKKILNFLIMFLLIFSSIASYAETVEKTAQNSDVFKYNITAKSDEWKNFETHDEMVQACRISSEILKEMTTEEVVDAVLDYPLLYDIYAFNNKNDAIEQLKQNSDAFRELSEREDSGKCLLERIQKINSLKMEENSLQEKTMALLLEEDSISKSIYINYNVAELAATSATVYTPKGSAVSVIVRGEELTASDKASLDELIKSSYPLATYVSSSTTNYNCHSYAWYSSSTSNKYWMNDPTKYMTDGSYKKMLSPMSASHMFYSVGDHSAKIYDAISNVISNATVISKWGQAPVMIHKANYSPYSTSGLSVWVKN